LALLHKLHRGAAPQKSRVCGAPIYVLSQFHPFFLNSVREAKNRLAKKRGAELKNME